MWYNKIKSKFRRTPMAAGDRVLPIYSGDETDLYFQVDGGDIYKEGDIERDAFSGDVTVKAGSSQSSVSTNTSFSLSYWDANRGVWDQLALKTADDWSGIHIVSGNSGDANYMGAFEGCTNFTSSSTSTTPVIDGEHTVGFFKGCVNFDSSLENWDFSNILRSDNMFDDCTSMSAGNFHNTLLKMHRDKNEAITVDSEQYIGAENIVIEVAQTLTLIKMMRDVGQIVVGYEAGILTMNSSEPYNTAYTYGGTKVVV